MIRSIGVLGMLVLCLYVTNTAQARVASMPGGNIEDPIVRSVDLAEPAVVRIITTVHGQLTVQFPNGQSATFPQSGPGYSLDYLGSGAFITSHGDILTADHVVKVDPGPDLDQYLEQMASSDIAAYVNRTYAPSPAYTSDDVLSSFFTGIFNPRTTYSSPTIEAYFNTAYTGQLTASRLNALPAGTHAVVDRIEQESPLMQKDTAIIHVNLNDTPSISLGDSTAVEPQDELTIIGFPGSGDISQKADPTPQSFLTPSINKIFVSSIKQTDEGAPVIQVGGNVENGDSGGPALDSSGKLVGLVSFGLTPNGGTTNFLQASQSAQEEIQHLHLDTTPGPFTKAWSQAFNDYAATSPGHWRQAQSEMQKLEQHYPAFQAVSRYEKYAQAETAHEPLAAPANLPVILFALALLLLSLGIIAAPVLRIQYQRARAASRATSTPPLPPPYVGEVIDHPQQTQVRSTEGNEQAGRRSWESALPPGY